MPSRRDLLRDATAGATVLVAGCLSGGATETPTPSPDPSTPPGWQVTEPFEAVTVGTPETPSPGESPRYRHQIRLWNRLSGEREIAVRLTGPDETYVEETVAIPVNEQFGVRIYDERSYALFVDLLGSETTGRFDVPEGTVDCNYSVDLLTFYGDDRLNHRERSTTKECGDEE